MENQFFVDSQALSPAALEKKHRLEQDPTARKSHMEYLPGMEVLDSDLKDRVLAEMGSYDYTRYTAADVKAALEHTTCSLEDFKALLSPAAAPFLEEMARKAHGETQRHFGNTVYLFTPLYIANYCENYCVYCGFNCYNHIQRMKLTMEQIQHEMEIIAQSGEQTGLEGCLSVPGKWGIVTRPNRVRVRAQDRDGDWFEAEAEGLTARAFCHEIEHLDGHLFVEHIDHFLTDEELKEYLEDEE